MVWAALHKGWGAFIKGLIAWALVSYQNLYGSHLEEEIVSDDLC